MNNYDKYKNEIVAILSKSNLNEYKIVEKIKGMSLEDIKVFLESDYVDLEPKKLTDNEVYELNYMSDFKHCTYITFNNRWCAVVNENLIELTQGYLTLDPTQKYDIRPLVDNRILDVKLLDYLKFNNSAYFKTNVLNTSELTYEVQIANINSTEEILNKCLIGARKTNVSNKNYIFVLQDIITYEFDKKRSLYSIPLTDLVGKTITIKTMKDKALIKLDDNEWIETSLITSTDFIDERNIFIGALNNGSNGLDVATNRLNCNMNYCKVFDNTGLILDLKPALDDFNQYAFYNQVDKTFIYPKGKITGGDY